MGTVIRDIEIEKIAEELARRGYRPGQRVSVAVNEPLNVLARNLTDGAERRGLTDEMFAELMKDE